MKTKFHPILFSTPMVQAILEGRKTQTRRTKGLDKINENLDLIVELQMIKNCYVAYALVRTKAKGTYKILCPYSVGDVLWVRETSEMVPVQKGSVYGTDHIIEEVVKYKADGAEKFNKWKPSIFMPKEACRIFLRIKSIRVERLNEISTYDKWQDAVAEGVIKHEDGFWMDYLTPDLVKHCCPNTSFRSLWQSINGKESWNSNPFVWVYEFEKIEKPDDF